MQQVCSFQKRYVHSTQKDTQLKEQIVIKATLVLPNRDRQKQQLKDYLKHAISDNVYFDGAISIDYNILQSSLIVTTPFFCTTRVAHLLAKEMASLISLVCKYFTANPAKKESPAPVISFTSTLLTGNRFPI